MDGDITRLKTPRYAPCGGCGADEPGQRCIGCLHDFGAGSTKIDPYKSDVAERLEEAERLVRVSRDLIPPPVTGREPTDQHKINSFNALRAALYRLPD